MRERILQIVADAAGKEVTAEYDFKDLDSLEFIEMLHEIESVFAVRIPDESVAHLHTVNDLFSLTERLAVDYVPS